MTDLDSFINDFYADVDSGAEPRYIASQYFTDECLLEHLGELFKNSEGVESWYASLKGGFENSFHQVKSVESNGLVKIDAVWMASFKNIPGNSRVRHKLAVIMDIAETDHGLRIKRYKSVAVG